MRVEVSIVDFDTFHRRVTNNELPSIGGVEVAMKNAFALVLSSEKPAKIVYNRIKELFDKNIIYSDLSAKCKKSNKLNGLFIYEVINKVCFSGVLDGLSDDKDAISLLCFSIKETECLALSKLSTMYTFDNGLYSCCETVTLRNNGYYHCDYKDSETLKTDIKTNANSEKQILVHCETLGKIRIQNYISNILQYDPENDFTAIETILAAVERTEHRMPQ